MGKIVKTIKQKYIIEVLNEPDTNNDIIIVKQNNIYQDAETKAIISEKEPTKVVLCNFNEWSVPIALLTLQGFDITKLDLNLEVKENRIIAKNENSDD